MHIVDYMSPEKRSIESKFGQHGIAKKPERVVIVESHEQVPDIAFHFDGIFSDAAKEEFETAQKEDAKLLSAYLGIQRPVFITYRVFETRKAKQAEDPLHSVSRASARFDEMTVYRQWTSGEDSHFPHEMTHLLAHTWGEPYKWTVQLPGEDGTVEREIEMVSTSFFQEGLAVAVDELVFRRPWRMEDIDRFADDWCRYYKKDLDSITSISQFLQFKEFDALDQKIAMPLAASFVKFLIVRYGMEKFRRLYTHVRETQLLRESLTIVEAVYDKKETDVLQEWKVSIFQNLGIEKDETSK